MQITGEARMHKGGAQAHVGNMLGGHVGNMLGGHGGEEWRAMADAREWVL